MIAIAKQFAPRPTRPEVKDLLDNLCRAEYGSAEFWRVLRILLYDNRISNKNVSQVVDRIRRRALEKQKGTKR